MKKIALKSSYRNVLGAFLGGVLGVLAFASIPSLLPVGQFVELIAMVVGCFTGVIMGYWYQEIAGFALEACVLAEKIRQGIAERQRKASAPGLFASASKVFIASLGYAFFAAASVWHGIVIFGQNIPGWLRVFFAVRQAPLLAWLTARPIHRAHAARFLAAYTGLILTVLGTALWVRISPSGWVGWSTRYNDWQSDVLMLVVVGGAIAVLAGVLCFTFKDSGTRQRAHRHYARFKRYGLLGTFLFDLFAMVRMEIILASAVVLGAATCVLGGAVFLFGIPVFLAAFVLVKILKHLVFRMEHLSCLAVTLTVTGVTIFFMRQHLAGLLLGSVAVANGCLCGAITLALELLFARWFNHSKRLQHFAKLTFDDGVEWYAERPGEICAWAWLYVRPVFTWAMV